MACDLFSYYFSLCFPSRKHKHPLFFGNRLTTTMPSNTHTYCLKRVMQFTRFIGGQISLSILLQSFRQAVNKASSSKHSKIQKVRERTNTKNLHAYFHRANRNQFPIFLECYRRTALTEASGIRCLVWNQLESNVRLLVAFTP